MLEKSILSAQKAIAYWSKKTKKTLIKSTTIRLLTRAKRAKSYNPFSANQPQAQASKKRQKSWRAGLLAIGVNITEVAKKDKDKAKDLSIVECYTCKQKGYYASRYLKKLKN